MDRRPGISIRQFLRQRQLHLAASTVVARIAADADAVSVTVTVAASAERVEDDERLHS